MRYNIKNTSKIVSFLDKNFSLVVGPLPPPIGGVSIFIDRLKYLFSSKKNVIFFNEVPFSFKKFFLLSYFLIKYDFKQVHIHSLNLFYLFSIFFMRFFKKYTTVLFLHNSRTFDEISGFKKKIIRYYINRADVLFFASESSKDHFFYSGISSSNKLFFIEPAFLPPKISDEMKIFSSYNKELKLFFKKHKIVVSASAFRLVFYKNRDLYGFDLFLDLAVFLKDKFSSIGFIFAISDPEYNMGYLKKMLAKIKKYGLSDSFFIFLEKKDFWPIIKRSSLFVRPTLSDGDSLAVREALFFNVPVLASNVVKRPSETVLFDINNKRDFFDKAYKLLYTFKK